MSRRALILGISGQDGAYLAELLLRKGYEVHGTSREAQPADLWRLRALGILDSVELHRLHPANEEDSRRVVATVKPEEVYYLAGQSSVAQSLADPLGTFAGIVIGLLNLLQAVRDLAPEARILNAASGDCFGERPLDHPATEESRLAPRSPYGAAKSAAHHIVSTARLERSTFICSAFLFNHESPLRDERFAIGKIVAGIRRIQAGRTERLALGNIDVVRDWGWAPEYVQALWLMLQQSAPADFIVATGKSYRLGEFVERAFAHVGLDWRDHVEFAAEAYRPADIRTHHADPSRAAQALGWQARTFLPDLPAALLDASPAS